MPTSALRGLLAVVAALFFAAPAHASLSVLDNGAIRVAVDLDQGGKLTWLSRARGEHADNLLFEAEQSYYGSASWHAFQDAAVVTAHSNDGHTLYDRAFSAGCNCQMETWITLHGNAAVVRNRLTGFRFDARRDPPGNAELPALYTEGAPYRVVTYDGDSPFMHAPTSDVSMLARAQFFVADAYPFRATEHWVALVDAAGFGVGLVEPSVTRFVALSGSPGGFPSGYVAGTRSELWDGNIVYDYTYALVVGKVAQVRAYAYAHRPDPRPNYVFAHDRQHFIEYRAVDTGFPIDGALRIPLAQSDPQLDGPEQDFTAARVSYLYVRGAWHSSQSLAALFWNDDHGNLGGPRTFRVVNDGTFHTYRVDLLRSPGYGGTIGGIRLDPVYSPNAEPGAWVDVTCISWKPCPIDRAAERRLLANPGDVPYVDPFDTLSSAFWSVTGNSLGATAAVADGALVVDGAPSAQPLPGQSYVSAGVYSRCTIAGDFDVQVDYELPLWPDDNGVNVNFSVANRTLFQHDGPNGADGVSSYFPPSDGRYAPTFESSGAFRFVRTGATVVGYFRAPTDDWIRLDTADVTRDPVNVSLSIFSTRSPVGAEEVQVAFDDFRINRGTIQCP
jgi:hypothetical protein